jgi:diguanylate cyclase (GGDEF)-like protein
MLRPTRSRLADVALEHADLLLSALPVGVALLDSVGRVVLHTPGELGRLDRRGVGDVEGRDLFAEVWPWTEAPALAAAFRNALSEDGPHAWEQQHELALSHDSGIVDLRVRVRKLHLGGEPFVLLVTEDCSTMKATQRALASALGRAQDEAIRDPLTSLFNRRHFEAILAAELNRTGRYGTSLSLLLIDVDHFKTVNDRFGHPVGDRVLAQLAQLMQRILRVGDTCARIGGEEFAALLPHTPAERAVQVAERLHRVVRALRLEDVPDLRVTVSVGIASISPQSPAAAVDGYQLIARTDEALYEAKRSGRNRTAVRD